MIILVSSAMLAFVCDSFGNSKCSECNCRLYDAFGYLKWQGTKKGRQPFNLYYVVMI